MSSFSQWPVEQQQQMTFSPSLSLSLSFSLSLSLLWVKGEDRIDNKIIYKTRESEEPLERELSDSNSTSPDDAKPLMMILFRGNVH